MGLSFNTNRVAQNAAFSLRAHYNALAVSVRRLSSGLRVEFSADDAAGLAARELMRADVSALYQGARNANDAISMIQTADGALSIIDEKLIRMKELAEQAATGTYDSTQRLMISSEYQAMAAEIDRIARATDFNGVKLLDGSLSGAHDGTGLNATGRLKVHFGCGNDSAEDYYYIEIGACTAEALGLTENLGGAAAGHWEIRNGLHEEHQTFTPTTSFIEYVDPDTGTKYYSDGENFYSNIYDPMVTVLDKETQGDVIARLRMTPAEVRSTHEFDVYMDPVTGNQYHRYLNGAYDTGFILSPSDPNSKPLDARDPAEKAIIDRLQYDNRSIDFGFTWRLYLNEDNKVYYTRDGGLTFINNVERPFQIAYTTANPDHLDEIAKLKPKEVVKTVSKPYATTLIPAYRDPKTSKYAYSHDGKTFYSNPRATPDSRIDPVKEKDFLDRLEIVIASSAKNVNYDAYYVMDGNRKVFYYTRDGGKTFTKNGGDPLQTDLDTANPAHAAQVAQLQPDPIVRNTTIHYREYMDPLDAGKKYYSSDGGKSFCTDITKPADTKLDKNDPGYAALVGRLVETGSFVNEATYYTQYRDANGTIYWTPDNGQTFVRDYNKPSEIALDKSNAADAQIIAGLSLVPHVSQITVSYNQYTDPVDGTIYYTPRDGKGDYFISDVNQYDTKTLDINDPAQKAVMDRLQPVHAKHPAIWTKEFPEVYYIYQDGTTGKIYYEYGNGTITSSWADPYKDTTILDPTDPADKAILDNLTPAITTVAGEYRVWVPGERAPAAVIETQQAAQHALVAIERAIVSKDRIRAHLGALQNRLENTITNLTIQAENLQDAESRISDVDVATEMTEFVRNQILAQSTVSMLAQANSLPKLLASLIQA